MDCHTLSMMSLFACCHIVGVQWICVVRVRYETLKFCMLCSVQDIVVTLMRL